MPEPDPEAEAREFKARETGRGPFAQGRRTCADKRCAILSGAFRVAVRHPGTGGPDFRIRSLGREHFTDCGKTDVDPLT